VKAALLLGSNQGDRAAHLRAAVAGLGRLPGTRVLARSRVYETAPVGPSKRPFLNQALTLQTALSPLGLLIEAKRLEAAAGRKPGPWGAPRPLDVDILLIEGARVSSRVLKVPHPELRKRAFALAPLAELFPTWTAALRRLNPPPGTVKIYLSR
jgi:2-amino-4-hydroxy-6-hydroxymethyldihydropteridine diphosphokinase